MSAIGVDSALEYQLQSVSSREELAWKIGSDKEWQEELTSLLTCVDTQCCNSALASLPYGIPKTMAGADLTINGTDPASAQWLRQD